MSQYPKISYGSGPTTLNFVRGPVGLKPRWAPVVHDNPSTSGKYRERLTESMLIFVDFTMPHLVVNDDLEGWYSFEAWALPGGAFKWYPNADLSDYYNCVLESSEFAVERNAMKKYTASFTFRILLDGQAPANPGVILRRFYGYNA